MLMVSYYFSIRSKIQRAAGDAINVAEDLERLGNEKMEIAVNQLYEIVPPIIKPFITKSVLQSIVHFTFDRMEDYAYKQNK